MQAATAMGRFAMRASTVSRAHCDVTSRTYAAPLWRDVAPRARQRRAFAVC
jgi:hypothetical protein